MAHVWVVEYTLRVGGRGWQPGPMAWRTRHIARMLKREREERFPGVMYRVRKFVREEA